MSENSTPADAAGQDGPDATVGPGEAAPTDHEGVVAGLREELAKAQDRHRRALADLDNYRKRTERDAQRAATTAGHRMLTEWLDAVDSVERALKITPDDAGLGAVRDQMKAILDRNGVHRIPGVGEQFDPAKHEAIAVVDTPAEHDQKVVDEARAGYTGGDGEVIRHAQVVVGRGKADGS